jgi:hypothetical protein
MRSFADTLPTLRGGEVLRADPREEAALLAPVLAKLPGAKRENPLERSRPAPADLAERNAARGERPASTSTPAEHRRATIPSLDDNSEAIIADRIAEAVAAARASAEREREQAVAAARVEARQAAEAEVAEARARWTETEATALAAALSGRLDAMEANLVAGLSRILGPLLETAVHERALARFRDVLSGVLAGPRRAAIVVKGPEDLLDAFREVWGDRPGVRFEAADRTELVADIGPTRIETALTPFKAALAEALATPTPTLSPKDRPHG